jgi:hypothetical protein
MQFPCWASAAPVQKVQPTRVLAVLHGHPAKYVSVNAGDGMEIADI